MERKALFRKSDFRSIPQVAKNGVSAVRELHPDLMMTPRFRPDLHPRNPPLEPQAPEPEHRLPASVGDRTGRSHPQQRIRHPAFLRRFPLHQRPVDLSDLLGAKLFRKPGRRLGRPGKNHNSGSRSVQPVHQPEKGVARLVVRRFDVRFALFQKGPVACAVSLYQHAGRFPDHKQMVVQIDDVKSIHRTLFSPLSAATL